MIKVATSKEKVKHLLFKSKMLAFSFISYLDLVNYSFIFHSYETIGYISLYLFPFFKGRQI